MEKKNDFSNSSVILVTHFLAYSASQALRDFLRKKSATLLYISHPLLLAENKYERSYGELSLGNRVEREFRSPLRFHNLFLTVLYEFFISIYWCLFAGKTFDLFVGVDNLNALQGLCLKKIGIVKRVVYYTIDYFPKRFENNTLNALYHFIDKLCVRYADETWNVSEIIVSAREKHNRMDRKMYNRQHTVPIGIWFADAPRKKFSDIDKHTLVFTGHLLPHMGVDLIVRSLPQIIREIRDVKLEIIGSGPEEKKLKDLAKELGVDKHVKFHGWVSDRKKLEQILSGGAIGLAPFNTRILDEKVRNADPGKIKDYLCVGLPVITTNAISMKDELEKAGCAIIIPYEEGALASAVIQLLGNEALLRQYRENAISYILRFDYDKIFTSNLFRVIH